MKLWPRSADEGSAQRRVWVFLLYLIWQLLPLPDAARQITVARRAARGSDSARLEAIRHQQH